MSEPTMVSLVKRIERLERHNRWLKGLGGLLLIATVVLALMPLLRFPVSPQSSRVIEAETISGRVIQAEQVIIKDNDGKKRAELGTFTGLNVVGVAGLEGPPLVGLSFYDPNGKEVIFLGDPWGLNLKGNNARIGMETTSERDSLGFEVIHPTIKLKSPRSEISLGFADSNQPYLGITVGKKAIWTVPEAIWGAP